MDDTGAVYQYYWLDYLHIFPTTRNTDAMFKLWQQSASGERQVSALRQRLKRPETYLVALFTLLVLVVVDSYRSPANQATGRLYVCGVHAYQAIGRPLLKGRIQCRYRPTCSDYSIEAVRRHGIRRGLVLTIKRINSCTTKVPLGTSDPAPDAP